MYTGIERQSRDDMLWVGVGLIDLNYKYPHCARISEMISSDMVEITCFQSIVSYTPAYCNQ